MQALVNCLRDVQLWLERNLWIEIILFGRPNPFDGYDSAIGPLVSYCQLVTRNLGVTFDCALKFNKQISSVVKTSFFQLSLLSRVKACLRPHGLETVIQAFICSHLDDSNSLHAGSNQSLPHHLQVDQNAELAFSWERSSVIILQLCWPPYTGFSDCFYLMNTLCNLLLFKNMVCK